VRHLHRSTKYVDERNAEKREAAGVMVAAVFSLRDFRLARSSSFQALLAILLRHYLCFPAEE
jgi:hypothetical protein